ncbi:MFS transporter [Fimbriimonadia bacterium ATM]|nr:MAG: MFS transporter [Armatimonadota bacterium]MBC6969394.1 MFS transporter [Armatimonadota bacterium]MCE7899268.1 MFS transporter [Armatimonadetes bacterium ATM1]MDL1927841.1 MFS transporter [Fimbriimonadia bacterium ATM]RIJ97328.1 MAG: hypothetical protein DCC45_04640 [Armatimonadota bacterium]
MSIAPPKKTRSPLSHSGFRYLWYGTVISDFGNVLHFMVFMWWAGEIAGGYGAGVVGFVSLAVQAVFGLAAGAFVDRMDRRRILVVSCLLGALVSLFLSALGWYQPLPPLWVLCFATALLRFNFLLYRPARLAAIPRLVPPEDLARANALMSAGQTATPLISQTVGTGLLGVIFELSKRAAYAITFLVDAITFVLAALFASRLPSIKPERIEEKHPFQEVLDGLRYLWSHNGLRIATILEGAFSFFVAPFMVAYVALANTTFKDGLDIAGFALRGPALLCFLEAGFFLGFVAGSLYVYKRVPQRVAIAYGVATLVGGLLIAPMGMAPTVMSFFLLNLACGLVLPFGSIPLETYILQSAPDAYRGRVNAAVGTLAALTAGAGMLLGGALMDAKGVAIGYPWMGFGMVATALIALSVRSFRSATLRSGESDDAETAQAAEATLQEA